MSPLFRTPVRPTGRPAPAPAAHARFAFALSLLLALTSLSAMAGTAAAQAPPNLTGAVSRRTHGTAGTFDITLPLTGASGIECRSGGAVTLVLTFDKPVNAGGAAPAGGTAVLNGAPVFAANTMTVNLTGVTDAQAYTVTLSNVTATDGGVLPSTVVNFRTLLGDVNANGSITGSDVNLVKAAAALTVVNGGNFRTDINANGSVTGADVNLVKAAVAGGASVAGGPVANTAPTISALANQTAVTGVASSPVGFTVADAECDPAALYVSAASDSQTLMPNSAITLGGTGASRTISVTPASGQTGTANVTVSVSDGLLTASASFVLTVTPPPTLYLATLQPITGVTSLGSGTATLSLSGDQTYAILKYTLSNLTSADTDDAVYSTGDVVLYDVPVGKAQGQQQPDGSFKWVFSPSKAAQIVAAIQSGTSYITAETANNPNGELRGTFQLVNGSQTFTPPAAPPAITINPPSANDASRFLQQAAFGGTGAEIAALSNPGAANASTAVSDWLTQQFNSPLPIAPTYGDPNPTYSASSVYKQVYDRCTTAQAPTAYGDNLSDDRVHEAWWKNAVTGQDQLRQRVATAWSEIFVVSENDDMVDAQPPGLLTYYDMLADDAFVNFRTLLGDVTLHPIMGQYLNMKGSVKAMPSNGNASPNENYAREIMQLFTIGLYMLQPDGTLMLDANGQPIPTYDQTTITNFAQVFTGWDRNNTPVTIPLLVSNGATPPAGVVQNYTSYYQKPMVVNPVLHATVQKNLLVYPGSNSTIPANSGQTAATATAELNFALDNIFNHPNVGPFVCRQLIQRLVGSNPSPAYVYRVAQVFNNNGSGVRGDMKAVLTAILTDYEARSTAQNAQLINDQGYGHVREPMIRMANIMRSLNATSKTGKWTVGKTDTTLAQTVFRSPTVFNFFDPHYSNPGVIQNAGLVSPEFDIIYETTLTNAQNMIYTGVYANYNADGSPVLTGTGFRGDSAGSDVYLNFSPAGSNLLAIAQGTANSQLGTTGKAGLIDQVNLLLMNGQMPAAMSQRILTFLNTLSATDYIGQTKAAVHLTATSAQCAAVK